MSDWIPHLVKLTFFVFVAFFVVVRTKYFYMQTTQVRECPHPVMVKKVQIRLVHVTFQGD